MHITEPRQQLDHMLRQTRNNLVTFSQMADTKAHILLSLSSVLLSLSLTQAHDPRFTISVIGLDLFLLITIYFALLNLIKVPGFLYTGVLNLPLLFSVWWVFPFIPVGIWVARITLTRVSPSTFEWIIVALLVFSSLSLFWQSR